MAGIVGVNIFSRDIWGDTVNIASRIENSADICKVNISRSTYELPKNNDQFTVEHRGKIKTYGKGEIDMYYVERKT